MKKRNRILALFLCAALFLSVLPINGFYFLNLSSFLSPLFIKTQAASGTSHYGDLEFYYYYDETDYKNKAIITDCSKDASGEIEIPYSIYGNVVTEIDAGAFSGCSKITNIVFKAWITSIGAGAFQDCTGLRSFSFQNTVSKINDRVFSGCTDLTSVSIPSSITSIGSSAFSGCASLSSISIPSSVTSIGSNAFSGSGLTYLSIPKSVRTIGSAIISNCNSLSGISVDTQNTAFHSAGNCLIQNSNKSIIAACRNSVIPSDGSILSIGSWAFSSFSWLQGIAIPEGVTSIESYAFSKCNNLKIVVFPDSITSIGTGAFSNCTSLTDITIPDNVSVVTGFNGCTGLTCVTLPTGATNIGFNAFSDCTGLTSITIPNSVTTIGQGAFANCYSLCDVIIPSSVNTIEEYAFQNCRELTSIVLPDNVKNLGSSAFSRCSKLEDVIISKNVSVINNFTFSNCPSIKTISIPNGVTKIDQSAFYNCTGLASVSIPKSVTVISLLAFSNCSALEDIYYYGALNDWYLISIGSDNDFLTKANLHCYSMAEEKAPTCGEPGYSSYYYWSNTEPIEYITQPNVVPPTGNHSIAGAIAENLVASTCTNAGSYERVVYCSVCQTELSRETIVTNPLGHDYIHHEAEGSTCSEHGHAAYDTCSRCDYTSYQELPLADHLPAEEVQENVVAATCTTPGSYERVIYCSKCGTELSRETIVTNSLGHDYIHHEAEGSTCSEHGHTAYDTCSRCDYTSYQELPLADHLPAEEVQENVVAATCTIPGSYERVIYCSKCGTELERIKETINPLNHDIIHHSAKEVTCTDSGFDAYDTCSRCDYSTFGGIIPATGHAYNETIIKNATCSETGETQFKCHCGDTFIEITPMLGHSFTNYIFNNDATQESDGTETAKCDRCEATSTRIKTGTRLANLSIVIRNFAPVRTIDYKTTITFRATVTDAPSNTQVYWYINGVESGYGESFTVSKATADYSVQCKLIGSNGRTLAESEIEYVKVNISFFAKLIAFFRDLFGSLPVITQSVRKEF